MFSMGRGPGAGPDGAAPGRSAQLRLRAWPSRGVA
jgi:hypothetical protein